jgi:tetratricopeptide (TPR) repeat protein
MATLEQFSEQEVVRIVGVAEGQLAYWQRLGLVRPRTTGGRKFYGFGDLISLRTIKQLTDQHVPARRLRRAVEALTRQLDGIEAPLAELRILSDGRSIIVQHNGHRLEPLSGQLLLSFETRELAEKVRPLPAPPAEEWVAKALELEADPNRRADAREAYRRALELRPAWVEARLNLGTLLFEDRSYEEAEVEFRLAVEIDPEYPLARFNLAAVLDEQNNSEEARDHLLEALRLSPDYADACYNLAAVCEKLGRPDEARRYWARYLEFDARSEWAAQARRRLAALAAGPASFKLSS